MPEFDDEVRVEYSVEMTVNVGNFQNIRPAYKLSANVRPGETPTTTIKRIESVVDTWLEHKVDEIRAQVQ